VKTALLLKTTLLVVFLITLVVDHSSRRTGRKTDADRQSGTRIDVDSMHSDKPQKKQKTEPRWDFGTDMPASDIKTVREEKRREEREMVQSDMWSSCLLYGSLADCSFVADRWTEAKPQNHRNGT